MNVGRTFAFLLLVLSTSCGGGFDLSGIAPDVVIEDRQVLVDPQAEEFRPTAKLVFIVDNSSSMKDEQTLLANGISSTFDQLKGYNLDIQIYTTSSKDSAELAHVSAVHVDRFREDGDGDFKPAEGLSDPNPTLLNNDYRKKMILGIKSAISGGGPILLRRTMSEDEITHVKEQIVSSISQIGADGSDTESGYCTAIRALIAREGDQAVLKAGDRVALVVISDDNDYTVNTECSAEITDLYKWVQPVMGTRSIAVTSDNLNYYSYATTWGAKERYQLDINYTDQNNLAPFWAVTTTLAQTEAVTISYTYTEDVNNDGQISQVISTKTGQAFAFDPAMVGNPTLAAGNQTCTDTLLNWVKGQALLGRDQHITSCTYAYSSTNRSLQISSAITGMGTSTSNTACSATTVQTLDANRALYPSLFIAGKRLVGCTYAYKTATARSKTVFLETPPVTFTGASVSCSANAALMTFATLKLSELVSATESPLLTSCTLKNRAASRTCNFDDIKLSSLPPGSTAADLPDQCANSSLLTYIASPRSACTAAQLTNLINYTCSRSGKTTATEIYMAQPAKFEKNVAGSTQKTALQALEERIGYTPPVGVDESTHITGTFQEAAKRLFGQSGFFFSAIIKPTDVTGCPGQLPGGGERYRDLAGRMSHMGYIHSICSDTYAPALDNISSFIVRVLNNSYSIPVKETEAIIEVVVKRGAQEIVLAKDTDYQTLGGSMTFTPDVLQLGDSLQVKVRNTYKVKAKVDF
jgi:hypothetical protein